MVGDQIGRTRKRSGGVIIVARSLVEIGVPQMQLGTPVVRRKLRRQAQFRNRRFQQTVLIMQNAQFPMRHGSNRIEGDRLNE